MKTYFSLLVFFSSFVFSACPDSGPAGFFEDADIAVTEFGEGEFPEASETAPEDDLPQEGLEQVEIEEGGFGWPCEENSDCNTGFCVKGVKGYVCTVQCLEDCPDEKWRCKQAFVYPDIIFLCIQEGSDLCTPCKEDAECGGADDLCLEIGSGKFCANGCADGADCPEGYKCSDVKKDGNPFKQCLPESGFCTCEKGTTKVCKKSNRIGECAGVQTCIEEGVWSECDAKEPAAEICDDTDNDCNGSTDENFTDKGKQCDGDDADKCEFGILDCSEDGLSLICANDTVKDEVCNGVDDNCDGSTDENFKIDGQYASLENCGACGQSCKNAIPFASETVCKLFNGNPGCAIKECLKDYYPVNEFVCAPMSVNMCAPCLTGADCGGGLCVSGGEGSFCSVACAGNGCPGNYGCAPATDYKGEPAGNACFPLSGSCSCTSQNEGDKRECFVKNDFGTCAGFEECDAGSGWINCDAKTPETEKCDGEDNNCNGETDEGDFPAKECSITNENGSCVGTELCEPGSGYKCFAKTPQKEICNGLDDNCNGESDEDFKTNGIYSSDENCGGCGISCEELVKEGTAACDVSGNPPVCKVVSCNEGYYKASDSLCLPVGVSVCAPCSQSAECGVSSCHALADGSFCLASCDDNSDCFDGFSCEERNDTEGNPLNVCVPLTGECGCSALNEGNKRLCSVENQYGKCGGIEECDGAAGWTGCTAATPEAETCDGLDNNCNGGIDDGLPDSLPCEQTNEFGTCKSVSLCLGTYGWVCGAPKPMQESCDLSDNDCDGVTDEDGASGCVLYYMDYDGDSFGVAGDGKCSCKMTEPYTALKEGDCNDDDKAINPLMSELCNGADDNCDGITDEGYSEGCVPYYKDLDEDDFGDSKEMKCLCAPAYPYVVKSGGDCDDNDKFVNPSLPEVCANGKDDNCNGLTDEVLTYFSEDFNDGIANGFTLVKNNGKVGWNVSAYRFYSPPKSLYCGDPQKKTYDNGNSLSEAISPEFGIPQGKAYLKFRYLTFLDPGESCPNDEFFVTANDSPVFSICAESTAGWQDAVIDISALAGGTASLEFVFDTKGGNKNGAEGVYVDDIIVQSCSQ